MKSRFEAFAKSLSEEEKKKLLVGRYNGINESPVFKNPQKLPALVYFNGIKDSEDSGMPPIKEQLEYQFTRDHMLRNSTDEAFVKAMHEFIKEAKTK